MNSEVENSANLPALDSTMETVHLRLSGFIRHRKLNTELARHFRKTPSIFILDLERVVYIDLQCVMLLIALTARFHAKRRKFILIEPTKPEVCDFLAAWDFLPALEHVLEEPSSSFLSPKDAQRLYDANDPTKNRYMGSNKDTDGVLRRLYSNRFFSLQTFSRQTSLFSLPLAAEVAKNWRQVMVENLLSRM